jgi:RecB family exonuclease
MTDSKTAFRPSSISRYTNCNLWRHLPSGVKSTEALAHLQKGTDAHKRLEKELFTDKEMECKAYFERIKDSCIYFFKEQHLEMEINGEFLEGTPDVYGYDESSKTLHVIDYKTGRSYVVAENNDQLLAYAMLIMNRHDDWKIESIELAILNTQHDAVNRHVYMGTLYVERLKARIKRAVEKNTLERIFRQAWSLVSILS